MDYVVFFQKCLVLVLVWCAFYCFIIRPGREDEKARRKVVESLLPGDLVVTSHGMRGVVHAVDAKGQFIEVEIAHGVVCSLTEGGIARRLYRSPDKSLAPEGMPQETADISDANSVASVGANENSGTHQG